MDYYEKYKHRMNELEAFNMVKVIRLILLPAYMLVQNKALLSFMWRWTVIHCGMQSQKTKQFPLPYFGAYPIPELY